jgi:hypothetical protein
MVYKEEDVHLCYDCVKAEAGTCKIYEGLTKIIDDHFDYTKILFQIPECEYFVPEDSSKYPNYIEK